MHGPVLIRQSWEPVIFLHWRIDPDVAQTFMPAGVHVDRYDDTTYVGLVLTGFGWSRAFGRIPLPYVGNYLQANVRLYTVDDRGDHGVLFLHIEAERLVAALAGRLARQSTGWASFDNSATDDSVRWRVQRSGVGPPTDIEFGASIGDPVDHGSLEHWLTDRWVGHVRSGPMAMSFRVAHAPWRFRSLGIREFRTNLLASLGMAGTPVPDVQPLWSGGVVAEVGAPSLLLRRR
jgi:uncharacterized protein